MRSALTGLVQVHEHPFVDAGHGLACLTHRRVRKGSRTLRAPPFDTSERGDPKVTAVGIGRGAESFLHRAAPIGEDTQLIALRSVEDHGPGQHRVPQAELGELG